MKVKVKRRNLFYKSLEEILKILNSSHPFDKEVITEMLDSGMDKEEILKLRDLVTKASKAYYAKR